MQRYAEALDLFATYEQLATTLWPEDAPDYSIVESMLREGLEEAASQEQSNPDVAPKAKTASTSEWTRGAFAETTVEYPFPNPTTGETTLPLRLAKQAEVSVELYDVLGRRVKEVARGSYPSGRHFVAINSSGLAGGLYFIRVGIATEDGEQLTAGRRFVVGQ